MASDSYLVDWFKVYYTDMLDGEKKEWTYSDVKPASVEAVASKHKSFADRMMEEAVLDNMPLQDPPNDDEWPNYYSDDSIVDRVMERIYRRSEAGLKKYGVTMLRDDVSTIEWLRHAQEEALDFAVYIERVIHDLENRTG